MQDGRKIQALGREQWPRLGEIVEPLLAWYDKAGRDLPWRRDKEAYHVWVSEIMLQQTQVGTVIPYYGRFMARCPDIASLAACGEEELLKLWEGLGYYARVKNMKKAAQVICGEYHGQFPTEPEQILRLPGIGAYTAGAIASIAFGKAAAAVDGNVLRVYTRLTEDSHDIMDAGFRRQVAAVLEQIYPENRCGDFTQSLMELGAVVCVPNSVPKCGECPVNFLCGAFRGGKQTQYPVKKKKAARKIEKRTVLILRYGDRMALRKREEGGLLPGMWELPNIEGHMAVQELACWLARQGISVKEIKGTEKEGKIIKHVFSHIEWHMVYRVVTCGALPEGNSFAWFTEEEIEEQVALPTALKKVYRAAAGEG